MLRLTHWLSVVLLVVLGLLLVGNWQLVRAAVYQPQLFMPADFDHSPPDVSRVGDQRHLLVFSKTNGYRHHAAIPAAQHMLEQIAANNSWFVYATENAAVFNGKTLGEFDVVVLNNSTGSLYTTGQRRALSLFLEGGGGLIALHAASDNRQCLGEKYDFAAMSGPDSKMRVNTDRLHAVPDQISSAPLQSLLWPRDVGNGKVVYSTIGDRVGIYGDSHYLKLITQAIRWVAPMEAGSKK